MVWFQVADNVDPIDSFGVEIIMMDDGYYRLNAEGDIGTREERFDDSWDALEAMLMFWPQPTYTITLRR